MVKLSFVFSVYHFWMGLKPILKNGKFHLVFYKRKPKKVRHHLERDHIESKICSGLLGATRTRNRYLNLRDISHIISHASGEQTKFSYDKKSDEGSNSVRMRPENSGALKVVKKLLSTRVSDSSDAQLSDYV